MSLQVKSAIGLTRLAFTGRSGMILGKSDWVKRLGTNTRAMTKTKFLIAGGMLIVGGILALASGLVIVTNTIVPAPTSMSNDSGNHTVSVRPPKATNVSPTMIENFDLPYPEGKRFPLGLYSIDTAEQMKQEGVFGWNIGHTYSNAEENISQASHQAEVSKANGWSGLVHLDNGTENQTNSAVSEQLHNGPIAWWDLPEEMRYWEPDEFNTVKNLSAWARKYDPAQHPIFMYIPSNYTAEDIAHYVPYLDIIGAGAYTEYMHQPRAWVRWRVESEISAIQQAGATVGPDYLHGEKTPIGIVGLFYDAQEKMNVITPVAAYHDFYSCLASGAKGMLVFSYFHRQDASGLSKSYQAYSKAASEISGSSGLGQALLFGKTVPLGFKITKGPTQTDPFTPTESSEAITYPSLQVLARQYEGAVFIIAVNSSEEPIIATITGLGSTITSLQTPFEQAIDRNGQSTSLNRLLPVTNGAFEDSFAGLEVHVYKVAATSSTE